MDSSFHDSRTRPKNDNLNVTRKENFTPYKLNVNPKSQTFQAQ